MITSRAGALFEALLYDDNGNVKSRRNRSGKLITYGFDALDRETSRNVPANAAGNFPRTLTTSYDLASKKWDVTLGGTGQTLSHRYDTAGRLNAVDDSLLNAQGANVGNLAYDYDAAGNRNSLTVYVANGTWTLGDTYDDAERLATVTSGGTTLATLNHDVLSRISGIAYADASTVTPTYENDDDLSTLTHTYAGGSLGWGYTHNGVHQITNQTVTDSSWEYKAGSAASYSVNALNQYTAAAGASPTYDANGNLTTDGTWTYEYDEENRLRSATRSGTSVSYGYDPLGRRRVKSVNSAQTVFVNDGADEVAELNGVGTLKKLYAHGSATDQHLALYDQASSAWSYVHANNQGSVVLTTNGSGVVSSNTYGPYGESAAAGNAFGYTGRYLDAETGLYYYRSRYYSPQWGRFLQTDSIGGSDDLNLYAYTGNDAVNGVDPDGRIGIEAVPIIVGAGILIIGYAHEHQEDLAKAASDALHVAKEALGNLLRPDAQQDRATTAAPTRGTEASLQSSGSSADGPGAGGKGEVSGGKDSPAAGGGNRFPDRQLPRDSNGIPIPDPEASGPHTQLGQQQGRNGKYDQAREFDANGKHVKDIDFTDHGRPEEHPNPHQHEYIPNPTGGTPQRGPTSPLGG